MDTNMGLSAAKCKQKKGMERNGKEKEAREKKRKERRGIPNDMTWNLVRGTL